MRDIKLHQEQIRTRFMENIKQGFKKTKTKMKPEGKSMPKMGIYDYDGSVIEPAKVDTIRYPSHYLEVDVSVHSKENIMSKGIIFHRSSKKKNKKTVKFECYTRNKDELRVS